MQVVEAVRLISAMFLIAATALSGCTGGRGTGTSSPPPPTRSPTAAQRATTTRATESPGRTASPAVNQTPSATLTTVAEVVPSRCADLECSALVMVPSLGRRGTERAFVLVRPDGKEQCRLNPAYVPWSSTECQVAGERVMCWDEERGALQILDVVSGQVETVEPELEREEARLDFLVSPDGERIVWSTTDMDGGDADGPEDTSRCRVSISEADGSDMRILVEETFEKPYHLMPVTWTPEGDGIFFARMRVWVESGGAFIPAFRGRYSELLRLDVASGEFQKVFPLDDTAVCNRCIGDISPDGQWLAYHREDGSLVLRDLVSKEETLVRDASSGCHLGHARLSPDGEHLVYVEMEGPCDEEDSFEAARTVMVYVPSGGQTKVLAESREAVD